MKQKNFFLILICLFMTIGLSATDYYVSSSGFDTNDGLTSGNAFLTIGKAVTAASSGDKIIIVGTINQDAEVNLGKSLTFEGESSAVIVGDGSNRLFNVSADPVTISFSDIAFEGMTSSEQGAVLNTVQTTTILTFTDCVFSGNTTSSTGGGGCIVMGGSGTATISGCTFYNNSATGAASEARGAGMIVYGTATVNLTNCTFFENTLPNRTGNFHGAAIRASATGTSVTATNCLFYDNTTSNANADFNAVGGANMTLINSIAQSTNNLDTNTASNITADLTNSSLTWNATLKKVTFSAANDLTDDTPIDFGNDNNDVGAWDSGINVFEGTANGAWADNANWSSGTAPIGNGTENVAIIGSFCNVFANEVAVNNIKLTKELRIQNQRVFIVNGESDVATGGLVRYFTDLGNDVADDKAWYLVSSPLSGEVFDAAFADKNDLAVGTTNSNRGVADYVPGTNTWNYLSATTTSINATSGSGFSMKITPDGITFAASGGEYADNAVGFEGDFNTDDAGVTTESLLAGFNLLGNPYAAHVNSTTFLGAATSSNIDQTQIWVWNQATEMYEVKTSGTGFILSPAQGFFVNVNTPGSVNFAESNQATTGGTFQKNAKTELKLLMSDGESNRFAKLYFSDNATKGFDSGWEGETFGGIANSLSVFTHLVDDNQGKKYQVQSLPNSDLESITVPVGIIAEAGKEISFSTETINFPADVKIFLEDRLNNTFHEISNTKNYKITLEEASSDVGRFYLHASKSALSTEDISFNSVDIFKSNSNTLKLIGLPNGKSNVKLFNILGKPVLNISFKAAGIKEVSLPNLATGVYIVQLSTEKGEINKKIVLE